MKNVIKLQNYDSPSELEKSIGEFVEYYNNHRYHESLENMTPVSIFHGKEVQLERDKIKRETITLRRQQNLVPAGV